MDVFTHDFIKLETIIDHFPISPFRGRQAHQAGTVHAFAFVISPYIPVRVTAEMTEDVFFVGVTM